MSNLLTRVLVAAVGIPLLVFITFQGGWVLATFVGVLSALGIREYFGLHATRGAHAQEFIATLLAFILPLSVYNDCTATRPYTTTMMVVGVIIVLTIELWRQKPHPLLNIAVTLSGLLYVPFLLSSLIHIRHAHLSPSTTLGSALSLHSDWQAWLMLTMLITVWTCDSAAYFTGMAIGNHKIFPRVSPKKSWEGSIGGFIFSIIAFVVCTHWMLPEFPMSHACALGAMIGIVGPIGDFAESLLKRDAAIKDSSALIPGHGGILDRFDSLLFVAPMMSVYLEFVQ